MDEHRGIRIALLILQAFVALTALAGGVALVMGSLNADFSTVLNPPAEYLEGSPFTSYVVPGILLGVVLGGVHALAFALLERNGPWALLVSAGAGFATLIWIFVQMAVIPFSPLQPLYFAIGLAEVGLVLLMLDVHHRLGPRRHSPGTAVHHRSRTTGTS
jgi:hypothetical protein